MTTLRIDRGVAVRWAAAVSILLTAACGSAEHVGVLRGQPTPLFDRFRSYQSLDELAPSLPDRSTWQVLADSSSEARGRCPRFSELTFVVDAEHHHIKGRLTLTLFNERLASVYFAPDDWPAYLAALERAGIQIDGGDEAHIPPATRVWKSDRNKYAAPFVGWSDTRFDSDVAAWIFRCA